MKVFVPFEEALVEELAHVGEALVPFRLDAQRGRVQWEQVEVLEGADTAPTATVTSAAQPALALAPE
ncbi:MAG: hypothetical protein AAGH19_11620 [Pseudomonadota bacterium]